MILKSYRLVIGDSSHIGEARRAAVSAGSDLGFSETQGGRAAIIAAELASNLTKHSGGGELIIQEVQAGRHHGLEFVTIDLGPGFSDSAVVMSDGFSTAGSQGTGLGAIKRQSEVFDLYSQAGHGTVFVARLWARENDRPSLRFDYGVISVPHAGEQANGDSWCVDESSDGRHIVMVADGLGHGESAAQASQAAVVAVHAARSREPEMIMQQAHGALRSTRGAAMAVAQIGSAFERVDYVGVGNIAAGIVTPDATRRMVSHDGTVGLTLRKVQKFSYPWSRDALLIMHSDGLSANWNLERYPGLLFRHPTVIAAVLYRDYKRKNEDDATILVAREAAVV